MLYKTTLNEIYTNTNPGVEYEIALFYKLLSNKPNLRNEAKKVREVIDSRVDAQKVNAIIRITDEKIILREMQVRGLSYLNVTFETQNDCVGPSDVVLYVENHEGIHSRLGLSVKFSNRNSHNPTARRFLSENQIRELQKEFSTKYIPDYIEEMREKYGHVSNWKRKTSVVAARFYDMIRDDVIKNWPNVPNKEEQLKAMLHSDSPIPFWIVNYTNQGFILETTPTTVDESRVNEIVLEKYKGSYVAFKLDGRILGKVQVKCNNGFIEDLYNHAGKAKRGKVDFIIDGCEKIKGDPFCSWDFTLSS